MTAVPPLLAHALSVLLPTPAEARFLTACLDPGGAGRDAWREWQSRVESPKEALRTGARGVKRLLPLLYHTTRESGAGVDPELLPYLRAAHVSEALRRTVFARGCCRALAVLAGAAVPVVVLKGAVLAETVYPDPALRHSHDVDILVAPGRLADARRALETEAFRTRLHRGSEVALDDPSGVSIVLHTHLFPVAVHALPFAEVWARRELRAIAGVVVPVASPADLLLHVGGLAACTGRHDSLQWACDAWLLLVRRGDLDWAVLADAARRARLALPLFVLADFLAAQLGAPVPAAALEHLRLHAAAAGVVEREAALFGARRGAGGSYRQLLRAARGWRERLAILKWMAFPSPAYLRAARGVPVPALPVYYAARPWRYLVRRLS